MVWTCSICGSHDLARSVVIGGLTCDSGRASCDSAEGCSPAETTLAQQALTESRGLTGAEDGPAMIRVLDIVAGAGGLSLGLGRTGLGFATVLALEGDPTASRTLERNFSCEVWRGPAESLSGYPDCDVVVGSVPQGGVRARWGNFVEAVRIVQPSAFVLASGPGLRRSMRFYELLRAAQADPDLSRYQVVCGVLNGAEYGVPQHRFTGFLLGVKDVGAVAWPPRPTHGPFGHMPYRTVRDVIGDLPEALYRGGLELHSGADRDPAFARNLHQAAPLAEACQTDGAASWSSQPRPVVEQTTTAKTVRLRWERPAAPIGPDFFRSDGGGCLHPSERRQITHREAARLQTFPDSFIFAGSAAQIAVQIAAAVPPVLAQALGRHLFAAISPELR